MTDEIPRHFVRLGSHAEKRYFLDMPDTYDALILNANLVVATTSACASLVLALKDLGKQYLIDPWTFVYGVDPTLLKKAVVNKETGSKELVLKRTYKQLADDYHDRLGALVGSRALTCDDFTMSFTDEFVARALAFQTHKLAEVFAEDEFFGEGLDLSPLGVIPPYFYIPGLTGDDDRWLSINLRLAKAAIPEATLPIFPMICIGASLLADPPALQNVADAYSTLTNSKGFLLWISDADERKLGRGALTNLVRFVQRLGRPTISMYGGYFSTLMTRMGLHGYSHGVAYGEYKSVEPVIGGLPSARYYFPPLHDRLDAFDVSFLVQEIGSARKWFSDVCGCPVCRQVIQADLHVNFRAFIESRVSSKANPSSPHAHREYPTGNAIDLIRRHYLHARHAEDIKVAEAPIEELYTQMLQARRAYGPHVGQSVWYLGEWAYVLRDSAPHQ